MTTNGNAVTFEATPGDRPPYYGPAGPVPFGDATNWMLRTLLVASVGGVVVGTAAGTLAFPIIGTVVGAVVGGSFGLGTALLTIAVLTLVLLRPRNLSSIAAHALFVAPTVLAVGIWAAFSLSLLYDQLQQPTGVTFDWVMIAAFAVPAPLALTLMLAAAPWCLQSRVPSMRRRSAGRRVWLAAIPIVIALIAAFPVAMALV